MRRFLFKRRMDLKACLRHPIQVVPKIFFSLVVLTFIVASYNYGHITQYQINNVREPEPERLRKDKVLFRVSRDVLQAKVLVVLSTLASPSVQDVLEILHHMKIKYDIQHHNKKFDLSKSNYRAVVFQNLAHYLSMEASERRDLDAHCKENRIGMIGFAPPRDMAFQERHKLLFTVKALDKVQQYRAVNKTEILRITRPSESLRGPLPGKDWTCLRPLGSFYGPLAIAMGTTNSNASHCYMVMADKGQVDGIHRVVFGNGFQVFLEKLLFLDALYFASAGTLHMPLERYIQLDIDDTLRIPSTSSITPADITEIFAFNKRMQSYVEGFTMNFGIIGQGTEYKKHPRVDANKLILENKKLFRWFDHTYHHGNMIEKTAAEIAEDLSLNKRTLKHLEVETGNYAVSPMHTGVYPVYQPVYALWRKITNVTVTSTPFYYGYVQTRLSSPLPPVSKGFIYRGMRVLPRKNFGVYTNYCEMDDDDMDELIAEARNGTTFLFQVYDYVNVYMTHYGNYGCDRPAIVVFEALIRAITTWTTLRLKTIPIPQLAELYFEANPDEREPLWSNPCQYWKQDPIWRFTKDTDDCRWNPFPNVFIAGQEEDETASKYLYEAIDLFRFKNRVSDKTLFFTDNYFRGLDWYYNELPSRTTGERQRNTLIDYDSKAFNHPLAPRRVANLIPATKIIMVLHAPEARAYRCISARYSSGHADLLNTTKSMVYGSDSSPKMQRMRFKCLYPGFYAIHLERWLKYFSPRQIMIVDADELAEDLVTVMDDVGAFIGLFPKQHYERYVSYKQENGSYCHPLDNPDVCLLPRKDFTSQFHDDVMAILRDYYHSVNLELYDLLRKIGHPVPDWLTRRTASSSRLTSNDQLVRFQLQSTL